MRTFNLLKFLYSFLFLILCTSFLFSQDVVFRVYPHIVRNDDGTGGITNAQLNQSKVFLNSTFNQHGIYFEYECTNYIYDTDLSLDPAAICNGFEPYYHLDGIDMFIASDEAEKGGFADSIPGTAITVGGVFDPVCSDLATSTLNAGTMPIPARLSILAHEMGHALGLLHTFESETAYASPTLGCAPIYIGSCAELVTRISTSCSEPNCETCGDKVCDTPADAHDSEIYFDPCDCTSIVDAFDACGDLMVPDGKNIMAYSPVHCRTILTEGQATRIKAVMANSPFLTASGSADLCAAAFCCNEDDNLVCIMDDQCDSYFVDHCETCSVQWISPLTAGNSNCIPIVKDTNFIYQALVHQVINGVTYSSLLEGVLSDFCTPGPQVTPSLGIVHDDIASYVYPNPSYDNLFVDNNENVDVEYELYDYNGQLVLKKRLPPGTKVNLNDSFTLTEGIYFGRYFNVESKIVKTERILIMR